MDHPSETFRNAAERAREIGGPLYTALADLFDIRAEQFSNWCGPHMSAELKASLAAAQAVIA
ncbi:hypothetical protein AB0467_34625 [Streptomyces sp. NPDC052095]|uniref:hypothetical protein n=1 Tax=unclassified Streptomyces TaxID=2593676 RepID=UPI00344B6B00